MWDLKDNPSSWFGESLLLGSFHQESSSMGNDRTVVSCRTLSAVILLSCHTVSGSLNMGMNVLSF